ncbi:MAG: RNA-directed DNA polymerase [Proteobacteria bacterium]|nr:MAG: RNA-directed DNA polymerase [Pseudomonadota bacterium]
MFKLCLCGVIIMLKPLGSPATLLRRRELSHRELNRHLGSQPGLISSIIEKGVARHYHKKTILSGNRFMRRSHDLQKMREILEPQDDLKEIQRAISRVLSRYFVPHEIAHAYVKNRGIVTNATRHIGARSMLHIDLADFFGSITQEAVLNGLYHVLEDFYASDIETIAELCCYDGFLPQGSPASPILSNLVCFPLDMELSELARSFGCALTRYSDDIVFSTATRSLPSKLARVSDREAAYTVKLGQPLRSLFELHGFELNMKKLRFQRWPGPLKVTGVLVGERLHVPREFRHNIGAALSQWKRHGIVVAARNHPKGSAEAFAGSLKGCIDHVGHVEGRDSTHYRRLLIDLETLIARDLN